MCCSRKFFYQEDLRYCVYVHALPSYPHMYQAALVLLVPAPTPGHYRCVFAPVVRGAQAASHAHRASGRLEDQQPTRFLSARRALMAIQPLAPAAHPSPTVQVRILTRYSSLALPLCIMHASGRLSGPAQQFL
jgi:hypothetical protein